MLAFCSSVETESDLRSFVDLFFFFAKYKKKTNVEILGPTAILLLTLTLSNGLLRHDGLVDSKKTFC